MFDIFNIKNLEYHNFQPVFPIPDNRYELPTYRKQIHLVVMY